MNTTNINIQQENNIQDLNEHILIKQFQQFNIEIYGTFEEPLFCATDLAEVLNIKNIRYIQLQIL